jgi:acyl-CoA synthetase (AMP-forming)/AMP-acid ligase II
MATAFLGIASAATCAPLNPAYRPEEFEFYLADLGADALVVPGGAGSPAREVAHKLGVPVIELTPAAGAEAGVFALAGQARRAPVEGGLARADDTALLLHTSGTTSRPKLVPLTQANLCVSAGNIRETLVLTGRDRCLNVMPLFHIHGLAAGDAFAAGFGDALGELTARGPQPIRRCGQVQPGRNQRGDEAENSQHQQDFQEGVASPFDMLTAG